MKRIALGVAVTFALLLLPAASADTLTLGPGACGLPGQDCGPFIFTADATDTSVTFSIQNTDSADWLLQAFSLYFWDGTITATFNAGGLQDGSIDNNTQQNNGAGNCNANGPNGAFCVDFTNYLVSGGQTYTWMFDIADGTVLDLNDWHVQVLLTCAPGEECADPGRVALSTTAGTQVPEPSSLALFGSGLIGVASLLRRKVNL